jgi:SAM-dependent methyltransferase/tetratricopeptide (TPR) repeat protein
MGEKKRRLAAGELHPGDARSAISRALELMRSGRGEEALAVCGPLFDAPLADTEALHYLGYLAIELGHPQRAIGVLERAIRRPPVDPHLHNTLAIAYQRLGQPEPAVEALRRAIALAPDVHEMHNNLGNALSVLGRHAEAAACYLSAARIAPGVGAYRSAFAESLSHVHGVPNPDVRPDLLGALVHEQVDPKSLVHTVIAVLRAAPDFVELERLAAGGELSAASLSAPRACLRDELLLRLLEETIVGDPGVERMLTGVRRVALECETRGEPCPGAPTELLCAVALQCFATEYAWWVTPEEERMLPAIRARVFPVPENPGPAWERALALLASYVPLHDLPEAAELQPRGGPVATLVQRQVLEPREEARLRPLVPGLDPIEDAVSRAVQAQYETHPYPRWTRLGRFDHAAPLGVVLKELFPRKRLAAPTGALQVLIAGCGTGAHSARTALRFRDAAVVAMDLSRASLAHAVRKTRDLGIRNIEYVHGDLLALPRLGRRFGLIECMGVLHHLRDPMQGWRALLDALAPDGYLRIGLYSELGRTHIVRGQRFAAERGHASTDHGIRALRQDLLEAARGDASLAKVARISDFYSISGTRDLLLHVQEHRYTLPALARTLTELGLEFLGFELAGLDAARRYRARYPSDPDMDNLANWQAFEESEPETFTGMYQFWARRARAGA